MDPERQARFVGLDGAIIIGNGKVERADGKPLTDWDRFVLETDARDLDAFEQWREARRRRLARRPPSGA